MHRVRHNIVVGIDEAGRGPLAGPVAVGVIALPKNIRHSVSNIFRELKGVSGKVRDSKQLTAGKREEMFKKIQKQARAGKLKYAVSFGSVKMINKEGIIRAVAYTMARALRSLKINSSQAEVLLDGSLKAPKEFKNQKTIVKGDEKEMIIALASICAKVLRDRKMVQLAEKYPKYNFDVHKGYGTAKHLSKIRKFAPCALHRRSFLRKILDK